MPNRLSDIHVNFVSLVSKASVRDPQRPDQPRRFILYKAESGKDSQMARQGVIQLSDADVREGQAEYNRIAKDATGAVHSTAPAALLSADSDLTGTAREYGVDPAANEGRAAEVAVTDDHRAKARRALAELDGDPLFGGALGQLRSVANGSEPGESDGEDEVAKALIDVHDVLAKGDSLSPVVRGQVQKAERDLLYEYGMRESQGVRNAIQMREQYTKAGITLG
jgi:hypothetical protein